MNIDGTDQYRHEDDACQCSCDEIFQSFVFLWMYKSVLRCGSRWLFVVIIFGFRLLLFSLFIGFLLQLQDLLWAREPFAFAEDVLNAVCSTLGTKNRGVKKEGKSQYKRLAMLSGVKCNSVLLEVCFISSQSDMVRYESRYNELVEKMVDVIIRHITQWIG